MVRRKWTYRKKNRGGRPRTEKQLEQLIVRLARENSDWGHGNIQGECGKLGHEVSAQTVAKLLRRYGIPPAPQRSSSPSWLHLMSHYKDQKPTRLVSNNEKRRQRLVDGVTSIAISPKSGSGKPVSVVVRLFTC